MLCSLPDRFVDDQSIDVEERFPDSEEEKDRGFLFFFNKHNTSFVDSQSINVAERFPDSGWKDRGFLLLFLQAQH